MSEKQYTIFGSKVKEPPQLTMARAVLGVGRNADSDNIKRTYRKLSMEWHPDHHMGKPTEGEAKIRQDMNSQAYKLLTDEDNRTKATKEFGQALQQPMVVGERVFSLGQLYGVRIYIPEGHTVVISDPSRLLSGSSEIKQNASQVFVRPPKVYGIRQSILESKLSDALVTYYGGEQIGKYVNLMQTGFENRSQGGLDDLPWIRNNDVAVNHFMNGEFPKSIELFREVNKMTQGNIIFMYRLGVCLEASASQTKVLVGKNEKWNQEMFEAIRLYESALGRIAARRKGEMLNDDEGPQKSNVRLKNESGLTVMMQLADAYGQIGILYASKAKDLWKKIYDIDPNCAEAVHKSKNAAVMIAGSASRGLFGGLRKIVGYLPGMKNPKVIK